MKTQKNVLLLCGGQSAEHTVSILSTKNIIQAIDRDLFAPTIVGIDQKGIWRIIKEEEFENITEISDENPTTANLIREQNDAFLIQDLSRIKIDVAFPVLHGPMGEDGVPQGMLEMLNIPYVGCNHGASYNCMDKGISKMLFSQFDLPILPYIILYRKYDVKYEQVCQYLKTSNLFIKPARMGSSIGTNKILNSKQYEKALEEALKYDEKIIIEPYIECREIECAALEDGGKVILSKLGEIIPKKKFYTFDAKYVDPDGADLIAPAILERELASHIQNIAHKAFISMGCRDMARIDFFIDKNSNKVLLNEINTIPGFTKISMYPKLLGISGVTYQQLITTLLNNALSRSGMTINFK